MSSVNIPPLYNVPSPDESDPRKPNVLPKGPFRTPIARLAQETLARAQGVDFTVPKGRASVPSFPKSSPVVLNIEVFRPYKVTQKMVENVTDQVMIGMCALNSFASLKEADHMRAYLQQKGVEIAKAAKDKCREGGSTQELVGALYNIMRDIAELERIRIIRERIPS